MAAGAGRDGVAPGLSLGGASARSPEELAEALSLADKLMYEDKKKRKSTASAKKGVVVQVGGGAATKSGAPLEAPGLEKIA